MSAPGQKDKFTPELRILVASLLSFAVIILWAKFFGPKPPIPPTPANRPARTAPATPGPATSPAANPSEASLTPATIAPAAAASVTVKNDSQERAVVVENSLYRVEISNRGAVVKSWQLKNYKDDAKPQRVLDVVHPDASQQTGGWPFSVVLDDEQLQNAANGGLYQISSPATSLEAPADVELTWSDGHLEVTKHFRFDHTYVVRIETFVKLNGKPITAGLGWLGGFGDLTVTNPAPVETLSTYYSEGGKITNFAHKKLEGLDKWGPGLWQGGKNFVGIEDRYFTAAFLPANGAAPGTLQTRYWKSWRTVHANGQDTAEPVPQVAAATSTQPLALRVYVGPKDYDDLKKMNPPLHGLINFTWLEFIAEPLFHGLKWLHNYIPNWGWAIVVLTLVINMLLFPLRISSYKTTLKMQRVAPEIKAIQEKYKKYSMRDPRKREMNKEVMAVYSREGINPMGGCFQMFLQMPVWFGLNTALRYAIEMRHATWLWITDLSSKDPYYVLPVLMGASMYLVSKMTPMTATDPQQQTMMKIMPITMAGIFMISPISSGLAVYILTSSVVGIAQQWYLNRTHPVPAPAKIVRGKKP
ncbi:MAG TPA: membrane protein insertase YidC [Candidatus Limnocylindria bacterium]|nr:membrane protein insertase YidC [Candidatus Limnocylindria bacterium]